MRLAFAVPGDLATPTGGYVYDRRMIAELAELGWSIDVIDLGEGFPRPSAALLAKAEALLAKVPKQCPIVIDGLAYGVMPAAGAILSKRGPLIALVHHPLALESGLSPDEAAKFRESERAALAFAHRVIVPSAATAKTLSETYDVPIDRITIARPGNDPVAQSSGTGGGVVHLLAVGSFVPRKGYDVLIAALRTLDDLPWSLTIAGDVERDAATAAKIRGEIVSSRLTERITVVGVVTPTTLGELYIASDLFVLASRYEGYGMAYAEAIAHGLPVVGTTAGAIPEAVPSDGAILVAPDDADALAHVLRRLITSKDERQRIAAAARAAAARLPQWRDSAKLFAGAIESVT